MSVFEGKYRPPALDPTVSVVAIGGAGRCEITDEAMIFDGLLSSVSWKTVVLGLVFGAGIALCEALLDEIGVYNFSLELLAGSFFFGLITVGLIRHQRSDRGRPVRYEVKLSGVKRVEPCEDDPRTLLIEAPRIRQKAVIFFRPVQGVEAFLEAYNRARA